jgi:predicted neuraminidase
MFVNDAQDATAYFRQARSAGLPKQVIASHTQNAGQSWQSADDLPIANPNSAVAGLQLNSGARILVLNNIDAGRYRLVLLMTEAKSDQWQVVEVIENDEAVPDGQRKEFSYPYLISVDGNDAHLVYTWDRKKIRHRYFSSAWLKRAQSQLSTAQTDAASQEAK